MSWLWLGGRPELGRGRRSRRGRCRASAHVALSAPCERRAGTGSAGVAICIIALAHGRPRDSFTQGMIVGAAHQTCTPPVRNSRAHRAGAPQGRARAGGASRRHPVPCRAAGAASPAAPGRRGEKPLRNSSSLRRAVRPPARAPRGIGFFFFLAPLRRKALPRVRGDFSLFFLPIVGDTSGGYHTYTVHYLFLFFSSRCRAPLRLLRVY